MIFKIKYATCNLHYAIRNVGYKIFNIVYAKNKMQYAIRDIGYKIFNIGYATNRGFPDMGYLRVSLRYGAEKAAIAVKNAMHQIAVF